MKLSQPRVIVLEDAILVENINCVDVKGKVTQHFDRVFFARDTARHSDGMTIPMSYTEAVRYCQELDPKRKSFLPDSAVMSTALAAIFREAVERLDTPGSYRDYDEALVDFLKQYSALGTVPGSKTNLDLSSKWCQGPYVLNTIVDVDRERVIHYPNAEDLIPIRASSQPSSDQEQVCPRVELEFKFKQEKKPRNPFAAKKYEWLSYGGSLDWFLQRPLDQRFAGQITGLFDLTPLIEFGDYLQQRGEGEINRRPAEFKAPHDPGIYGVSLGAGAPRHSGSGFEIYAQIRRDSATSTLEGVVRPAYLLPKESQPNGGK